jgi:hypothetical protein
MGVKIIEDLWANGISAELAVDASSLEELMAKYREHNHRWIVIAKRNSIFEALNSSLGFELKCKPATSEKELLIRARLVNRVNKMPSYPTRRRMMCAFSSLNIGAKRRIAGISSNRVCPNISPFLTVLFHKHH